MRQLSELNIFLVDDDIFYQNCLEQLLRNIGCERIASFSDGTSCLNHLQRSPDIVFLDHNMESLTGYEVLKKIKRFNPNINVVMLSAQEEINTAVDSLKHGAFDYIQKGDDEAKKIESVLNRFLEVDDLITRSKPSVLKKFFLFF